MTQHLNRRDFLNLMGLSFVAKVSSNMFISKSMLRLPYEEISKSSNIDVEVEGKLEKEYSQVTSHEIPEKPNILVIVGDNHHYQTLGCAGHPFIQTPGLDRMANEGIRFENTFCTTPLCSPSRASILTGTYANHHQVFNNHTPWSGGDEIVLEYLSREGYQTGFIGKWHMPGKGLPNLPFLNLFITFTYREGQGAYFNCPMVVNGMEVPSRKAYITEEITDYAIEFLRNHKEKTKIHHKPFCLFVVHRAGHPPYQVPEQYERLYDNADIASILPDHVDPWWYGKADGNIFQGVMSGSYYDQYRKYCRTLTAMDYEIQKLLTEIDHLGYKETTMVIYLSDNGMQWGTHHCHGIREPYEDSIRLPLLVRAPWFHKAQGTTRHQMALNIDIAPTILDAANIPIPEEMDGVSFIPIIKNPKSVGRKHFLLEFWRYFPENTPSYRGVRTEEFKFIEFEHGRSPWLFTLKNDPGELNNIFDTEEGIPILKKLEEFL